MKIRLEKELLLIITPESYVEQVALRAWSEKNDVSGGGLLIEAYAEPLIGADDAGQKRPSDANSDEHGMSPQARRLFAARGGRF